MPHPPAVAAAGSAAAQIGFDDGDRRPRIELVQAVCRPQSGEAAADDADIEALLALKPARRRRRLARHCLLEPQGARSRSVRRLVPAPKRDIDDVRAAGHRYVLPLIPAPRWPAVAA